MLDGDVVPVSATPDVQRIEAIARVCHEANRAYCITIGDESQLPWDIAEEWQRQSAKSGVEGVLSGRIRTLEQAHEQWLAEKRAEGWVWGPAKDALLKTHPCMVEYSALPPEQKVKDRLFFAVVWALW